MSLSNHPSDTSGRHRLRRLSTAAGGLLRRFDADEGGNVIITAAILLPILIGAVGMGVSYSMGNSTRNDMQNALDSSVLAGVIASNSGGDPIGTATTVFQSNLTAWAKSNASGINPSFNWSNSILTGEASGTATNLFGGVIGTKTYTVTVNSAATSSTTPLCVLGLNGLDNGSFDINGSKASFNATCAVQSNTTSSSGMTAEGKPTANAKKFGVTGGHKGDIFSPAPADGSPKIADPYASLPFPSHDACGKGGNGLDIKDDTTLSPGTFCGGIHIFATAHVTLQPGIYVMVDGPFWTDGSAVVTGDQVMIAFTGKGSTIQLWGDSQMTLTSPVSGTYMNMQFMQDTSDSSTHGLWASIGGNTSSNSKLQYDGVAYFPDQNFWTFGNASINANSPSLAIVADKIWTQGSASVNITNNNTRNLPVTPPTTTYGARLIK
jgi:Flp pilus assembly protein TadG